MTFTIQTVKACNASLQDPGRAKVGKTTQTMGKAKKAARRLLRENRNGRTWRAIAAEDFDNQIHFSVLSKFAHSDGSYIPGDVKSQRLLGLYRKPRRLTPATIQNTEMGQSWTLYMRELIKSIRTPTPKELSKRK